MTPASQEEAAELQRRYAEGRVAYRAELAGKLGAYPEVEHASDCAVHNEPAYPAGPCNCRGTA